MTKEEEIMCFLHERVFDPILTSPTSSRELKSGVNLTIARMEMRNAEGIMSYFWSAISGTDHSIRFARMMEAEGYNRFEEVREEFRARFTDNWLYS